MDNKFPFRIPKLFSTPERIRKENPLPPSATKEKITSKLTKATRERLAEQEAEELDNDVYELMELSAARASAALARTRAWGVTVEERESVKEKLAAARKASGIPESSALTLSSEERAALQEQEGGADVIRVFDETLVDPALIEFTEENLAAYDKRIAELSAKPAVLAEYQKQAEKIKGTFVSTIAYERIEAKMAALELEEAKLRRIFEQPGRAPGPIENRKFDEIAEERATLVKERDAFPITRDIQEMYGKRQNRRIQMQLERHNFAETDSRTELIRELLPDLLYGNAVVLFQGETGSGKTQLAKYISEAYLGKEPVVISFSEQIRESAIKGKGAIRGGESYWKDSPFVTALKEGRPIILDEFDAAPHEFNTVFNELLQRRIGDRWQIPETDEYIVIRSPIFATANIKSARYRQRYKLDPATSRRFIGGAGAREIHYLDIGKRNKDTQEILAPETIKILTAVISDRHRNIAWSPEEAPGKQEEFLNFVRACRKIQEDFTLSVQEGAEESQARGDRLVFKELVMTLKDQIEIMKAWKAGGFREKLEDVVIRKFFRKAQLGSDTVADRINMIKVFRANHMFAQTQASAFGIPSLSQALMDQWQGKA